MIKKFKNKLDSDVHLKDLLGGSALAFVLKSIGIFLNFVLFYVISSQIGGEGLGFYNTNFQLLIVIGTMCSLGLNQAILRFVGQYSQFNFPKLIFYFKRSFLYVGLASIGLCILLFYSSPYIIKSLGLNENYIKSYRLISISLPFYSLSLVSIEFLRGLKKIKFSETLRSVLQPGLILSMSTIINFTSDLQFILSLFISCLVLFLLSTILVLKSLKDKDVTSVKYDTKELFKTSTPLLISNTSSVLLSALPIFFLNFFTDEYNVGIYSLNFKIASIVATMLMVVNTIAAPKISELYWNGKRQELIKLISQMSKLMFLSSMFICTLILIFGRYMLTKFDESFVIGYSSLVALTLGQLINGFTGSVGVFMSVTGYQRALRNKILIAVISLTVGYAIIVPYYGLIGASIISALGASYVNLSCMTFIKRKENISTYYYPWKKSTKLIS